MAAVLLLLLAQVLEPYSPATRQGLGWAWLWALAVVLAIVAVLAWGARRLNLYRRPPPPLP